MEIMVTPVSHVYGAVMWRGATHVISLLVNEERPTVKLPPGFNKASHLFLDMDDVIDADAVAAPTRQQVQRILDWAKNLPQDSKLLIHCFAGVSRSTAAALAIKVQELGVDRIDDAILWLTHIRPQACPNPIIIKYADEILGANGKLLKKSEDFANAKLIKMLRE